MRGAAKNAASDDVSVSVDLVTEPELVTCYLGSLSSAISSSYVISVSILCYVIPCVILVAMYWNIYKVGGVIEYIQGRLQVLNIQGIGLLN